MKLELFRCSSCGKIYDRGDFSIGMSKCMKCGCGKFTRTSKMSLIEEIVYLFKHPNLVKIALQGELHV